MRKFFFTLSLVFWNLGLAPFALAHNQSPATIRKSMHKAFSALQADKPSNVFKGGSVLRVAGTSAQVFVARKDAQTVGQIAQLEIQEQTYVVAVDASGAVKAVVRDGVPLPESEWKELPFVETVRIALTSK